MKLKNSINYTFACATATVAAAMLALAACGGSQGAIPGPATGNDFPRGVSQAAQDSAVTETGTVSRVNTYGSRFPMVVVNPGSPYSAIDVYMTGADNFKVGQQVVAQGTYQHGSDNQWIQATSMTLAGSSPGPSAQPTSSSGPTETGTVSQVDVFGSCCPMIVVNPGSPYENIDVYMTGADKFREGQQVVVQGVYMHNSRNHWIQATSIVLAGSSPGPSPQPTSTATTLPSATPQPSSTPTPAHTVAPSPSPTSTVASGQPITVIIFENYAYVNIVGSSRAPYLNSLISQGAFFTNSHGTTHPSEGNYFALFAGDDHGIVDDGCTRTLSGPSLMTELGPRFGGWAENDPGDQTCTTSLYHKAHVPWKFYGLQPPTSGAVTFMVPNLINDMHDGGVTAGDDWLRAHLPGIAGTKIITFDEGEESQEPGNHIYTLIMGPGIRPSTHSERIDHYSIVRYIEEQYGLPMLGHSGSATRIVL